MTISSYTTNTMNASNTKLVLVHYAGPSYGFNAEH